MGTQIGAQMFTLRDHLKTVRDATKTCAKLKKMGYDAIQVSAFGKEIGVDELAKMTQDEGLEVAATHISLDLAKDTEACVEYHEKLKCSYTAIGGFRADAAAEWTNFTKEFSDAAADLKPRGVHLGYHNHSHEWAKLDTGERPIDTLVKGFKPEAWFELDTYWVAHAGGDPAWWIRRVNQLGPDRVPCVHVKDMAITADRQQRMCEVGDGNLNWDGILDACRDAGVRWYLVERDSGDLDPFESLKRSLENLHEMGVK